MSTAPVTAFVGRVDELQRLRDCAAALQDGRGSLVLLEGDAGAGKTRMVEELRPTVAAGALEYVRAPYAPVRDLIRGLERIFPKVLKNDAALAAELNAIMELHAPGGAADLASRQRKLLDAVVRALEKFSTLQPLILAVEDVHWIDRASGDVLEHLARSLSRTRILLVVTYRDSDAAQHEESRRLTSRLRRHAGAVIALQPLTTAEAMLLVNEAAPVELGLAQRRAICELAQGSPLLLLELTRHAAQDPSALSGRLPASLQALVQDRLVHFHESDRNVLRVCAAMERFDIPMVCEIARVDREDVTATLRKARGAGIVAESGEGFVFRHALMRRAITDDILAVELAALHASIARHLEAADSMPLAEARLAYHYWMARDRERCAKYNAVAAEQAIAVYAFDDAALFYERAIGDRLVDAQTAPLFEGLAHAYERAGRFKQAVDVYRRLVAAARAGSVAGDAAQLSIDLSRCYFHALDDEGSIRAVREALEHVDQSAEPALAFELHALLGWYLVHLRRTDQAFAALERAQELLSHAGGIPLIRYHEARAAYEVHARGGGCWKTHAEAALRQSQALDPVARMRRYTNAMALAVASEIDDYPFAFELLERSAGLAEENPQTQGPFYALAAWIFFVCGRLAEARRAVERLLPLAGDNPTYAFRVASVGIPLALAIGDQRLLGSCARPRLLEEAFASNDPIVFGPLAAAVAEQLIAQNRAGEAVALVERTVARIPSAGNNFHLLMLAARIGSAAVVDRALTLLEPWIERSASARASARMIAAFRETGKQRTASAQQAAQLFVSLPWPLSAAEAFELGGEIDRAYELYCRCEAGAQVRRIDLQRRRANGLAACLSKRETEVAELVALGNSNRAIAERLVLSERTVENHIASIFTKLNMRSRAEIASFIARSHAATV